MIRKIFNKHQEGIFNILYPKVNDHDSGVGSIGRIDHVVVGHDLLIPMHTHQNDEILSYFRQGVVRHTDSEHNIADIHGTRLMLMKAGKWYQHEEYIEGGKERMEGLQIFIRPRKKDGEASVQFADLDNKYSYNQWRLLASSDITSNLNFTSETWIYDVHLDSNNTLVLPDFNPRLTYLLYVFNGQATVNSIPLEKRESLLISKENIKILTNTQAELVLFVTNEQAEVFKGGMFSGNKL